ncbi:MAG: hypothetical protein JNL01_03755 [Bdellovibrionales bacterium]|nr:hypothetical protein [Bdellovibrionales bacterium]
MGPSHNVTPLGRGSSGYSTLQSGFANSGANSTGVIDHLESVLSGARQIELALVQEKQKVRALQEEMSAVQATYERLLRDERAKGNEISTKVSQLRAATSTFQENERSLKEKLNTLSSGYRKAIAELQQYRNAWAGVLQREREARSIIQEGQKNVEKIHGLEDQNRKLATSLAIERQNREQIERHAKSYQSELQNALVRLHSAEARFNELQKEYQALSQSKKSIEEEVSKVEKSIRERLKWELVREKERLRADLARENQEQLDKQRDELRAQFGAEVEERSENERQRARLIQSGLETEIRRLKTELEQQKAANQLATQNGPEQQKLIEQMREANQKLTSQLESTQRQNQLFKEEIQRQKDAVSQAGQAKLLLAERIQKVEAQLAAEKQAKAETQTQGELNIARERTEFQAKFQELERKYLDAIQKAAEEQKKNAARVEVSGQVADAIDQLTHLNQALQAEADRSKSLEMALITEKRRFDRTLDSFRGEMEKLRSVYPLKDLIASKEMEADRLRAQIENFQEGSILHQKANSALNTLENQKNRLAEILKESEGKIESNLKQIEEARSENTISADLDHGPNPEAGL